MSAPTPQKKRRRWWLVLLLFALPVLVVGGAWQWLQSAAGEALLKRQVLDAASKAIAGKVELDRVRLDGNHLLIEKLRLYTPEGQLVASIERLEADVDLAALSDSRVHLSKVDVDDVKLLLVEDERGWNLSRAIASKTPSAPSTGDDAPLKWAVELDALALKNGFVSLDQPDRHVKVEHVTITADAKVDLATKLLDGHLALDGDMTGPLTEKLTMRLEASRANGQSAVADVKLGETALRANVDVSAQSAQVEQLQLGPKELAAFVEGWPLKVPVLGQGVVGKTQASLALSLGKARVTAGAKYDLARSAVQTLSLEADDVDPNELLGVGLPSKLNVKVNGSLDDWRRDSLAGAFTGEAHWLAEGERLVDATFEAKATDGEVAVKKLVLDGPGVGLSARGTLAKDQTLSLFGQLEAKDLATLDRALVRFAGTDAFGLRGGGKVSLWVKGPVEHPALKLLGKLDRVEAQGARTEQLTLDVDLPDVRKPLETDVLLHATRLHLGERAFEEVTLDFLTRGRDVDLDFSTKGMGDLQANVLATLDKNNQGAKVTGLTLKWADAAWTLEAPTALRWGDVLALEPLVVHDGARRLSAQLKKTRKQLDATLHAEKLDLARLPKALALDKYELAGTLVSLDVGAHGAPSDPEVTAKAEVKDGHVLGLSGLSLFVDGTWKNERLGGVLRVGTDQGSLNGDFDLPLLALRDEKPEPLTGRITFEQVPTSLLEKQLERKLPVEGQLSGTLMLTGTGEHPKLRAEVTSPELSMKRTDALPLKLSATRAALTTRDDDTFELTLATQLFEGKHALTLGVPFTWSRLRKTPPTRDEWLAMPLTLELTSTGTSLNAAASANGEKDDEVKGTATVTGHFTGTPRAPLGSVTVSLAKVVAPPLRDLDLNAVLRTDQGTTRLTGTAKLEGQQALEWSASLAALPEVMLAPLLEGKDGDAVVSALADVPLGVLATVAPFDLAPLLKRDEKSAPSGTAHATLEVNGTLEAPTARLLGTVNNLRFDRVTLGGGRFDVRLSALEQAMVLQLTGQGGDVFTAKGKTGVDVRLSRVRKGLEWRSAPVELSLDAKHFDLGFLSGATESLRVVGGQLDLSGQVSRTLGDPAFVGDAALQKGRLALAGRGEYRDITCALHVTNELFDLKQLDLTSGAGKAHFVARAEKRSSGAFHLTSSGNTERFPLVNDDQLLAALTLEYSLSGNLTDTQVELDEVNLPRAEVLLPEVKRKDLQDLQRPKDIIILRSGARATKRQREAVKVASSTPSEKGRSYGAVINAPKNLWVRSSDVNLELGLSEGFRVDSDDEGTRLTGEARVLQGTLSVIGREFSVQKGSAVRFAGPATQPYVNVTALHVNTKEDVKITVTVAGKGTDVNLKATSEPSLPESDIYALLATGRRTLKTNGGASITPGQAASVVGQLAASQLKSVIAKKVPIDVFNFETSDNFEKVRVDVGKYLGDSLYLGATMNLGARRERGENTWAGRLEWQMSRGVSLEAYAGDALSFGADAVWSQDF